MLNKMFNTKNAKSAKIYKCEPCNFVCSKKNGYTRHLSTLKHQKIKNLTNFEQSLTEKGQNKIFQCGICDKIYKSRVGLWYHEKKCN